MENLSFGERGTESSDMVNWRLEKEVVITVGCGERLDADGAMWGSASCLDVSRADGRIGSA